jgi:eukaryotic-like serine/threonine-protein kinase
MMNENEGGKKCSRCAAPLPADAPEGLCPRCLMALNLSAPTEEYGPGGTKIDRPKAEAPRAEDLAKLFPQFEALEFLGRGGMGFVYKARQPRLDRWVALKILAPDPENRGRFAERFEQEARALAKLSHPNIVNVFDFGETSGLFYLVMEFVDGLNLRDIIVGQKMKAAEALAIVPAICDALQYAHSQGIVHRDIKPENILLDKQGRVKIADFGIAKIIGAERKEALTGEAQAIGTPHYMAPEQVEKPAEVDHRADIYSLGVVFYEMLTGELPLGRFAAP